MMLFLWVIPSALLVEVAPPDTIGVDVGAGVEAEPAGELSAVLEGPEGIELVLGWVLMLLSVEVCPFEVVRMNPSRVIWLEPRKRGSN